MVEAKSRTYLILFALWLMVFSASSQVIIIAPILPRIGEALSIPAAMRGTLITAYAAMLGVFALIIGPISDHFGRRRVLLAGSAWMTVALLLHGIANSYTSILIIRAIAGAAGGMLSGGAVSYLGDYFPYERRGWAAGWVMSGIAFGQIIGVPIGTLLADAMGFRWPFLMFAFPMLVALVLIWRVVPQPPVTLSEDPLRIGHVVRTYTEMLREPKILASAGAYFLMFFSVGLYVIYLPTWLEGTLGMGGNQIALMFFAGGLANVITGPYAGRLSDSIGRKPLIVTSCIGLSVVMLVTTWVTRSAWIAYPLFAVSMMMVAMRISPLQSLITGLVPSRRRGMMMSLAVSIGQIGTGIGGAVAGIAYTYYGYTSNTIIGAASILMMAWLVYSRLPEPKYDGAF